MFVDFIFRASTVRTLIAAVLSRTERVDLGLPGVEPLQVRHICSWSPTLDSGAADVLSVNLNTALRVVRNDPVMRMPSAARMPGSFVTFDPSPRAANKVVVSALIEVAVARTAAVVAANLGATNSQIVSQEVLLGVDVQARMGPDAAGAAERQLVLTVHSRDGTRFPAEFLGNERLAQALNDGLPIVLSLAGLETALGGVSILAANIRGFPDADLIALRLFFVLPAKFLPPPSPALSTVIQGLHREYFAFNEVSTATYQEQLGQDEIIAVASEEAFGQIFVSSMDQLFPPRRAPRRFDITVETARHEMQIVPNEEGRLSFRAALDIRLRNACPIGALFGSISPPPPPPPPGTIIVGPREPGNDPDLVAGLDIRSSIERAGENLLFRTMSAQTRIHAGTAFVCGLGQWPIVGLGAVGGAIGLSVAGFAALVAFPIALTFVRLSAADVAAFAGFDNNDQRRFAHDPATGEIQRLTPLPRLPIPIPSNFTTLPDPFDPVLPPAPTLPKTFGEIEITSISSRRVGRSVRVVMRLLANIAGGNLRVSARPLTGTSAPAGRVADWGWSYRSCNIAREDPSEIALATAIRVSNGADPLELFRWNATQRMELCSLRVTGATERLGAAGIQTFDAEWLDSRDNLLNAHPRSIRQGDTATLVLSIPLSRIRDLILLARGFRIPGQVIQPNHDVANFLTNPGFLILRTSAGRRTIELPPIPRVDEGAIAAVLALRELQCTSGRQRRHWERAFAGLDQRIQFRGHDPFVLVDRLLNDSVRAQLPRLNLPNRNAGGLYSLEQRSVNAVLGRRAPNNAALAGLGPSNLNNIPAPMAAPIGLARLPRRP